MDPANYRPIALLTSLYKNLASFLHRRLSTHLESQLSDQQFGFRKTRSTAQPLFIIRRIIEYAAAGKDPLSMIFSDWRAALDRVSHEALIRILHSIRSRCHTSDSLARSTPNLALWSKILITPPHFIFRTLASDKGAVWHPTYSFLFKTVSSRMPLPNCLHI